MTDSQPAEATVRIDRWLWAARLVKTRSQAGRACTGGKVKLNGTSVKAAKPVRVGDEIDVDTPGGRKIVLVLVLAEKRGAASVAVTLYDDRSPPPPPRDDAVVRCERGAGRPDKRQRRRLNRLRGR
jgi:ribosome-associated heat shock protein Hsp15